MPSSGGSASDAPVNKVVDGKSHYLAYITPDEGQSLKQQGGQEVITDSGIPAYPPLGEPGTSPGTGSKGEPVGGAPGGGDPGMHYRAPDTSMVGDSSDIGFVQTPDGPKISAGVQTLPDDYSIAEIEKGYTNEGVKLSQVGAGKYMTKEQMYNTGLIEKDPNTGEDVQGRYRVNENTGELERTDMSFAEHWNNAPGALKYSPTLRLLYASGKNIGEWMGKKGFEGYNEAGLKTNKWGFLTGGGGSKYRTDPSTGIIGGGDNESRQMMNELAPEAPYIISGTTQPTNSPADNWYQSLGNTKTSGFTFSFANELAAAKAKQAGILGNQSAVGWLAVNQSPFYNFLKERKLDKGIL